MFKSLVITTLLATSVAFTPTSFVSRTTRLSSDAAPAEDAPAEAAPAAPTTPAYKCITKAEIMSEPNTIEFGGVWDPLGLAELGSDETLAWFRHAEVKHGRVAMAAFTGWAVVGAGLTLPGDLTREGLHFADIPKAGLAAWDAVPGIGKVQMLIFAGLVEFHDEIFAAKSEKFGGGKLASNIPLPPPLTIFMGIIPPRLAIACFPAAPSFTLCLLTQTQPLLVVASLLLQMATTSVAEFPGAMPFRGCTILSVCLRNDPRRPRRGGAVWRSRTGVSR
jgi:hypothetical protein